jgi:DNA-binding FadR family transcriptional regulator
MLDRPDGKNSKALARLQEYIREGGFEAGDRLPPERQLIEELGMSRSSLRHALEALERSGAIWRHVGKGTFIGQRGVDAVGTLDGLADLGRQMTPLRMMQARLCIEPALAREAAIHATAETMAAIRQTTERARAAGSWAEYEAQDDRFHRAVAEATDNALLLSFFDQLNRVRRTVAWGSVERSSTRPPPDHSSFSEHEAVLQAISERAPDRAWQAMHGHLKSVSARLFP